MIVRVMEGRHLFTIDRGDLIECVNCGVHVETDGCNDLRIECPAGECREPVNHRQGCVFIATMDGAGVECSYCGRVGSDDQDGDDWPDWFVNDKPSCDDDGDPDSWSE